MKKYLLTLLSASLLLTSIPVETFAETMGSTQMENNVVEEKETASEALSEDMAELYTVTYVDIESGETIESGTLSVQSQRTYRELMGENKLADGTKLVDCVWYDANQKMLNLDDNIAEETIFTYHYHLEIIDQEGQALDIYKREGQRIDAFDLIFGDEDLSQRIFEDETGETIDLVDLKLTRDLKVYLVSETSRLLAEPLKGKEYNIKYDINLIEKSIVDSEFKTPKINGQDIYTISTLNNEHKVLAPSVDEYFFHYGTKYMGIASFAGWEVIKGTGKGNTYQPDEILTNIRTDTTLRAKWTIKYSGEGKYANSSMVNFFVRLDGIPEGSEVWGGKNTDELFTKSVYVADCQVAASGYNGEIVLGKNSSAEAGSQSLNEVHDEIVTKLKEGYRKNYFSDYFKIDSFPTDEQVLQNIRALPDSEILKIKINGKATTDADALRHDLNDENYTIKWNKFFSLDDGWHVDGILVAKEADLTITKVFAGEKNEGAGTDYLKNFVIEVQEVGQSEKTKLVVENATTGLNNPTNVAYEYDETTQTHKWHLKVKYKQDYIITENTNIHSLKFDEIQQYQINEGTIQTYPDDGIKILSEHTNRIDIYNTYKTKNKILLQKIDGTNDHPIEGVEFDFAKAKVKNVLSKGNNYSPIETSTLRFKTNEFGQIYLGSDLDADGVYVVEKGTYILKEYPLVGYQEVNRIVIIVDEDGIIQDSFEIDELGYKTDAPINDYTAEGRTVMFKNEPEKVHIQINKVWAENTPKTEDVAVQIYRRTIDGDVKVLNEQILNEGSWSSAVIDLPKYINGQQVQYTVKETRIGNYRFDKAIPDDGYKHYNVSYNVEREGNNIVFTITNEKAENQLVFNKYDNFNRSLAGAEFTIYNDEACEEIVEIETDLGENNVAVSNESGLIKFIGIMPGTYYVKETLTPVGFLNDNQVYKVVYNGEYSVVYSKTSGQWKAIPDNRIINEMAPVDVTIKKVVSNGNLNEKFDFVIRTSQPIGEPISDEYTLSADKMSVNFSLSHNETVVLKDVQVGTKFVISEKENLKYEVQIATPDGIIENRNTIYTVRDIDNTITFKNSGLTQTLRVSKVWDDAENQDNLRPKSVKIQLYADDVELGDEIQLDAMNNWTYDYNHLPVYGNDGMKIDYSVKETAVPKGYASNIIKEDNEFIITNTHTPLKKAVKICMKWEDNDDQDGLRKDIAELKVNLLANGELVQEVTLKKSENWTKTIDNLDRYALGEEITYTVEENLQVDDYGQYETTYEITDESEELRCIELTNTHEPFLIDLTVAKEWKDEGHETSRPETIKFGLIGSDGSYREIEVNASTYYEGVFVDLPLMRKGERIVYKLVEEHLVNYQSEIDFDDNIFFVTNTYYAKPKPSSSHKSKQVIVDTKAK